MSAMLQRLSEVKRGTIIAGDEQGIIGWARCVVVAKTCHANVNTATAFCQQM